MIAQEATLHSPARRESRLERLVRQYPGWASFAALAVGDLVLAGWRWDIEVLKSVVPGFVGMNPMTALALALSGLSLWLLRDRDRDPREMRLGRAFAIAVACIGALRLFGYLAGWDRGIDTMFYAEKLEIVSGGWRNRMAPNTALACVFIGASLALLDVKTRRGRRPSEPLAVGVILLTLFALIGYAYSAGPLYGIAGHIGMALHTSALLFALSLGVLCARPDEGHVALLTGDTPGGAIERRLMPAVLGIPIVLGWLRLTGQRAGYYDTSTGTALFVIATVVVLAVLVRRSAVAADRSNAELNRSRAAFESLFEALPGSYLVLTPDLRIVTANAAYLDATMTRREDLRGRDVFDAFPNNPDDPAATGTSNLRASLDRVRRTLSSDTMAIQKYDVRRPDGAFVERFWSPINSPVLGGDGKLEYVIHRVEDVTEFVRQKTPAAGGTFALQTRMERMEAEIFQSSQKVQAASRKLEFANKELESFSYSVSHDLRAPLRHINGFADLLAQHATSGLDATGRRYLDKIRESATRMGVLIDEILLFSKMSRAEVLSSRVSLRSTAEQVIADLHDETGDRAIEWRVGPLPDVEADASMLRQVLANLIGNAVKYTKTRTEAVIEIGSIDGDAGEVVIFVRDNGVGFDMRYAGKLFGVFQRLHRDDEFEGTGIGLANVRRIVERHGGRTWAEGRVDRGAIFYFSLPRAEVRESALMPSFGESS